MMPIQEMTRAQLAVLWLWARLASPDTQVQVAIRADVLHYPELRAIAAVVN